MPQAPLGTSSTITHVTGRKASPSTDRAASVTRSTIAFFWAGGSRPSRVLTVIRGIAGLHGLGLSGDTLIEVATALNDRDAGKLARASMNARRVRWESGASFR